MERLILVAPFYRKGMADWLKYGRSTAGLVTLGAAAATAAVYYATRPTPLDIGINLQKQTQTAVVRRRTFCLMGVSLFIVIFSVCHSFPIKIYPVIQIPEYSTYTQFT